MAKLKALTKDNDSELKIKDPEEIQEKFEFSFWYETRPEGL